MIPHTLQFAKKCNSLQILFEKTFAISFYLYYVVCLCLSINVSYVKKRQKSLLQKGSTWCHYLFKYLLPSMEIIFVPVCLVTWLTRCQTVSQDSSLLQKTQTVASKLFLQAAHFCSSKSFRLNRDSGSSGAFQLLGDVHTRCSKIFAHKVLSKIFAHKVFSNICATIFTHIMIPI